MRHARFLARFVSDHRILNILKTRGVRLIVAWIVRNLLVHITNYYTKVKMENIQTKDDILYHLQPRIRKFVAYLLLQNSRRALPGKIHVLNPSSSLEEHCEGERGYANKFTVSIPYAGKRIEWNVKFNDEVYLPPDFRCGDNSFVGKMTFDSVCKHIPSWFNWDSHEPSSLYNTLMEFLKLYREHEIKKLEATEYSRVRAEFVTLMNASFTDDEVEVLVDSEGMVHFHIAMKTDLSLVAKLLWKDSVELKMSLIVTFPRPDSIHAQSEICVEPSSTGLSFLDLGNDEEMPLFPASGSLKDYVVDIQKFQFEKIGFIMENYVLKQAYIIQLLYKYRENVLDFDANNYSNANLKFDTFGFKWMLGIVLTNKFPVQKPTWILRSIPNKPSEKPITEILHDYPYNIRWKYEDMVQKAIDYTIEKLPTFKKKLE